MSPAPPRKDRAPCIPLRRRLHAASCNLPAPLSCCLPGKNSKQPAQSLATINHSDIPGLSCRLQKNSKRPASPNEDTQSKEVGPQPLSHISPLTLSAQPPCLQKSSKAGVPPLLPEVNRYADKKPSPVGRAEDMPVCLFAQGPFASAEYLVQLTSSLAQKVCLARGSPCPPGEWLKSHIAQPRHPKP